MPRIFPRQLLPVALVAVALLFAAALYLLRSQPEQVEIERQPLLVDVAEVVKEDIRVDVRAQGNVSPRTETTLVTEVAGKIVEVAPQFEAGGFFRQGDVLLRIDERDYRADIARAEAAVARARSALAQEQGRSRVAYDDWVRSGRPERSAEAQELALRKPQLAQARAELESAQAELAFARDQLARTKIRAPYDGMLRSKQVGVGQYVTTGTRLGDIFAVDYAEVRLPLPQAKLEYLDLPQPGVDGANSNHTIPVQLYAQSGTGLEHRPARLVRTEGVIDSQRRVLFAVARVDDPYALHAEDTPALRIGTFVSASIQGRLFQDLVALPRAVLRAGNRLWVVDEQQRLRDRKVEVLRTDGELIYVRAGLKEGELVSLSSLAGAVNGTSIRINRVRRTDEFEADPAADPEPEEPALQLPAEPTAASSRGEPPT